MFLIHKTINIFNIIFFNLYTLSLIYDKANIVIIAFPLIYLYVNIYMFYQLYIYDYVDHALNTFRLIEKINPRVSQVLFNNDIESVIDNISKQIESHQLHVSEESNSEESEEQDEIIEESNSDEDEEKPKTD